MTDSNNMIYILVPVQEYEAALAEGYYRSASLEPEGFIHASPAEQLTRVANKFYLDKKDLRVLHIDLTLVRAEVRWEKATGGLYPHIYGPLNLDAVVKISRVHIDADGKIRIDPKEL